MSICLDYLFIIVEHCEGILSFEEAKEAVSLMRNVKTAVLDGLPAEFCKNCFHFCGWDFIDMIIFVGELTTSQLFTLIFKDRDFHFLLKFWRLIPLLNVDYKIVSKYLVCHILPDLISPIFEVPGFGEYLVCKLHWTSYFPINATPHNTELPLLIILYWPTSDVIIVYILH